MCTVYIILTGDKIVSDVVYVGHYDTEEEWTEDKLQNAMVNTIVILHYVFMCMYIYVYVYICIYSIMRGRIKGNGSTVYQTKCLWLTV